MTMQLNSDPMYSVIYTVHNAIAFEIWRELNRVSGHPELNFSRLIIAMDIRRTIMPRCMGPGTTPTTNP